MHFIEANNIIICRNKYISQILFCMVEGNTKCKDIMNNVKKLEEKYLLSLQAIWVKWDDLYELYKPPKNINCYTVFFLRFGYTIGTVQNPDYRILEKFFLKCLDISVSIKSQQIGFSILPLTEEDIEKYDIKLNLPGVLVYNFIKDIDNQETQNSNTQTFQELNLIESKTLKNKNKQKRSIKNTKSKDNNSLLPNAVSKFQKVEKQSKTTPKKFRCKNNKIQNTKLVEIKREPKSSLTELKSYTNSNVDTLNEHTIITKRVRNLKRSLSSKTSELILEPPKTKRPKKPKSNITKTNKAKNVKETKCKDTKKIKNTIKVKKAKLQEPFSLKSSYKIMSCLEDSTKIILKDTYNKSILFDPKYKMKYSEIIKPQQSKNSSKHIKISIPEIPKISRVGKTRKPVKDNQKQSSFESLDFLKSQQKKYPTLLSLLSEQMNSNVNSPKTKTKEMSHLRKKINLVPSPNHKNISNNLSGTCQVFPRNLENNTKPPPPSYKETINNNYIIKPSTNKFTNPFSSNHPVKKRLFSDDTSMLEKMQNKQFNSYSSPNFQKSNLSLKTIKPLKNLSSTVSCKNNSIPKFRETNLPVLTRLLSTPIKDVKLISTINNIDPKHQSQKSSNIEDQNTSKIYTILNNTQNFYDNENLCIDESIGSKIRYLNAKEKFLSEFVTPPENLLPSEWYVRLTETSSNANEKNFDDISFESFDFGQNYHVNY